MFHGRDATRQEPRQNTAAAVRADRSPDRSPAVARLHLLQRTAGNAAVGQVLQRVPLTPQEEQRREGLMSQVIKVTPAGYAAAHGVADVTALNRSQMADYLQVAVHDDLEMAQGLAPAEHEARMAQIKKDIKSLRRALVRLPEGEQIGEPARFLNEAVPFLNEILSSTRNRDNRYNVAPKDGHQHNTLNPDAMTTTWADDREMWAKTGSALGNPKFKERSVPAQSSRQLAVRQLPWGQARKMLPRPMLNLLFDVRYQLESGGLVDERTPDERQRRVKSPTAPGTLRSWHQDDAGKLPDRAADVPAESALLHDHYDRSSQSGAGSSIQTAAQGPRGLAEYTGTGSNSEHNTKIVLDYKSKKVYLTLTHYQFWALAQVNGTTEFWPLETQDMADAEGRMNRTATEKGVARDSATLMSPWVEIQMLDLAAWPAR
ncbi:hypothetical protein [Actinoplanes utahensis]|uniref:hypothetical protein n=1 Tax=Actinoplanes utahensis TaxID=1869 RepID=UPI00068D2353|nr:hypothetical protein [Actinoplanes utahensis]GIF28071.1 hypothetical protein Aut01nite_10570 [Actinoplanes utahensis]